MNLGTWFGTTVYKVYILWLSVTIQFLNLSKSLHHNLLQNIQQQSQAIPHRFPWFPNQTAASAGPTAPGQPNFQIPDFIKHAAQQQLAAQQAIKVSFVLDIETISKYYYRCVMSSWVPFTTYPCPGWKSHNQGVSVQTEIMKLAKHQTERNDGAIMLHIRPSSALKLALFQLVHRLVIYLILTNLILEYGTGRASKQFGLPESTARGFRDKLIKMLQVSSTPFSKSWYQLL